MTEYVATFYTHLAALSTRRELEKYGIDAVMEPAPRVLGASCGTCVRYCSDDIQADCMHRDFQAVYRVANGSYEQVKVNDTPV